MGTRADDFSPRIAQLILASEQGLRRIAMCSGRKAMFLDAYDLGFEQGDACFELVLRIRPEILGGQKAGGVAPGARTRIVIHRGQSRNSVWLLSTGPRGIAPLACPG